MPVEVNKYFYFWTMVLSRSSDITASFLPIAFINRYLRRYQLLEINCVGERQMIMQHLWNDMDRKKTKTYYKTSSSCFFVHHRSHMN
jgi:hypothetical protein